MSVLLSAIETSTIAHGIFRDKGIPLLQELANYSEEVAKAQLKTVVEWLDRNSVDIIHNGIDSRVMPFRVWESLKEEAGL